MRLNKLINFSSRFLNPIRRKITNPRADYHIGLSDNIINHQVKPLTLDKFTTIDKHRRNQQLTRIYNDHNQNTSSTAFNLWFLIPPIFISLYLNKRKIARADDRNNLNTEQLIDVIERGDLRELIKIKGKLKSGLYENVHEELGVSLLHVAILYNKLDIIVWLLNNKIAHINELVDAKIEQNDHIPKSLSSHIEKLKSINLSIDKSLPIHLAVMNGDQKMIKFLVNNKASLNAKNQAGFTVLHFAVIQSTVSFMEWLWQQKFKTAYDCSQDERYPFMLALQAKNENVAIWLLNKSGKKMVTSIVQQKDKDNNTSLHYAASVDNVDIVKRLIELGCNVNATDNNKSTPLMAAVQFGSFNVVKYFVKSANAKYNNHDSERNTLIHYASKYGRPQIAQWLLDNNFASVDEKNHNNDTALILAIQMNHIKTAKLLLQNGASVNVKNNEDKSPMDFAHAIKDKKEREKFIKTLIEFELIQAINQDLVTLKKNINDNPKLIELKDKNGRYLLHLAIENGDISKIEYLLNIMKKNDTYLGEITDKSGNTALHTACEIGDVKIIKLLLDRQLPRDKVNNNGDTPMHIVCRNGSQDPLRELLNVNSDVNVRNGLGLTPLAYAVSYGHPEIINIFVGNKLVNFKSLDNENNTLMHIAVMKRDRQIVNQLLKINPNFYSKTLNNIGFSPLHLAAKLGWADAFEEFTNFNRSLIVLTDTKATPLHIAMQYNRLDVVKKLVLLLNENDLTRLDSQGRSPMDYAQPNSETREFLSRKIVHSNLRTSKLDEIVKPDITNLVFQGGGVKGLAYIGALDALDKKGVELRKIQNVAGTSAGAITALLVSLGLTLSEIEKESSSTDLKELLLDSRSLTPNDLERLKNLFGNSQENVIWRITKYFLNPISPARIVKEGFLHYGLFDGIKFQEWAENIITGRMRNLNLGSDVHNLTFNELHQLKENYPHAHIKDIYLVACNVTQGKTIIFSYENTPDAIIADAVRASMSIPLFFKPSTVRRKINNEELISDNDLFIDGGVVNNYALQIFGSHKATLGLRLIPSNKNQVNEANNINNVFDYLIRIVQMIFSTQEFYYNDDIRTIKIDTMDIDMTDFGISDRDKELLRLKGKEAVDDYVSIHKVLKTDVISVLDVISDTQNRMNIDSAEQIFLLFLAASDKDLENLKSMKLNLEYGRARDKMTALHIAALYGREDVVGRLIKCNANLSSTNRDSKYAIDIALEGEHLPVILTILNNDEQFLCSEPLKLANFLRKQYERDHDPKIKSILEKFTKHHKQKLSVLNTVTEPFLISKSLSKINIFTNPEHDQMLETGKNDTCSQKV